MSNTIQRSFTLGEVAPRFYARTDSAKYALGLRTLRNMLVMRTGGAMKRPGSAFAWVVGTDGNGPARYTVGLYLTWSGADVVWSSVGPEQLAFVDVEQDGNYWLIDLSPVYLVADGAGGLALSSTGPATAILVDGGAGDIAVSTDLTATPIADLHYDSGGDCWLVRRACPRLFAVQTGADVDFYTGALS